MMGYMSLQKAEKIGEQMLNELYINSIPRITWAQFVKKYGGTKVEGYKKHKISGKKSEQILEKYKKKVTPGYRNSLSILWLNYAPVNHKEKSKTIKHDKYVNKCKTCYGYGIWKYGDPVGIGPIDFSDGEEGKKCPECGATGKHADYWKTLDGRLIYIGHLTDNHLKNIIADMGSNNLYVSDNKIKKILAEQKKRNKK
jgi:hypothetical protein